VNKVILVKDYRVSVVSKISRVKFVSNLERGYKLVLAILLNHPVFLIGKISALQNHVNGLPSAYCDLYAVALVIYKRVKNLKLNFKRIPSIPDVEYVVFIPLLEVFYICYAIKPFFPFLGHVFAMEYNVLVFKVFAVCLD
jgi:hypothetical protein